MAKRGPKGHQPTPELIAKVEALAGFGINQNEIARYIEIDPKTLRKHYGETIALGGTKANVQVARALHANAVGGNVTAAIFWLKARAGWKDQPEKAEETQQPNIIINVPNGA